VYFPGPAILDLGTSVLRESNLRGLARRPLERLCATVGETTAVAVVRGRNVLYIDTVESSKTVRVGGGTGLTLPAHVSASGKAMLAAMSGKSLRHLFPDTQLPGITGRSIVSRAALDRELELVRERGYATSYGEGEVEVAAVGAAICDRLGRPRAGVAIRTPLQRLNPKRAEELSVELTRTASEIAASFVVPRTQD
jgi:DNA-binding IclR family transcriptional regulator